MRKNLRSAINRHSYAIGINYGNKVKLEMLRKAQSLESMGASLAEILFQLGVESLDSSDKTSQDAIEQLKNDCFKSIDTK